jgi:hypothetical protein
VGITASILVWCLAWWVALPAQAADVHGLIAGLESQRNERLYYQRGELPANVQDLIKLPDATMQIILAYRLASPDPLVRFNLITILVHRLTAKTPGTGKLPVIACLVQALGDSHPWVRTEATWGLGLFGSPPDIALIAPLLSDDDSSVRLKAQRSIESLERRFGPVPW